MSIRSFLREFPTPRQTRLGLLIGLPLAVLHGPRSLVWAVPNTWKPTDKLTAARLNENFASLDSSVAELGSTTAAHAKRLTELEARPVGAIIQWPFDLPGDVPGAKECAEGFVSKKPDALYYCLSACHVRCAEGGYKTGFHTGTGDWLGTIITCACIK